jgi:ATP-dependent DNA helicase RecG
LTVAFEAPFTVAELESLLQKPEAEHLEFKEAANSFEFDRLLNYCCALANEGGGWMILGVTDKRPRRVCGTKAFKGPERTVNGLTDRLHLRVSVTEVPHPAGRVLVFRVPARPAGFPIQIGGTYWMRSGESLVGMTSDQLRTIFNETGPDYTAEICKGLELQELGTEAIESFRRRWIEKSGRRALASLSVEHLLTDAELLLPSGLTYAALILFGSRQALGRHLAQSEIIYEYRSTEAEIRYQDRVEYRDAFFLIFEDIWSKLDARNDLQSFQDGLFRREVSTFNEGVVREALLNAACHRDYRLGGSVFVKQYPRRLEIVSPGGFPPGVTSANILHKQTPRNRRLAETFSRCGLVERSGQGLDIIYSECIRESKSLPDFNGSDDYQVAISLDGQVQDPRFIPFLERVMAESQQSISLDSLLAIHAVYRDQPVPAETRHQFQRLVELGILEQIGRGKGRRFVLARRFYSHLGEKGAYTRVVGLDRETNKALLLRHIQGYQDAGTRLAELKGVLPALSEGQIQVLLREMRDSGSVRVEGKTRGGKWFPEDERSSK